LIDMIDTSNHLHSQRLLLRPISVEDIEAVVQVSGNNDPSRISTLVDRSVAWWCSHGYGVWIIVDPNRDQVIGWCGLRPEPLPDSPELFFGLSPESRGKGLATEAATTVINYALGHELVASVWAATEHSNEGSVGVMQRAGMQREDRRMLDGVDSVIYRIKKPGTSKHQD
jgi:RimJ/RimL family protein N-acetyltransferase